MFGRNSSLPETGAADPGRWRKTLAVLLASVIVTAAAAYVARRTLLLAVARTALNHDSALVAQERADRVAIVFPNPPAPWITPMKNQMNEIWEPIKSDGVNYYMFGGPRTWLTSYSERSNPESPYYQAWVGGYVIKLRNGSLPRDLQALAWQVTALDQRSWLSAMGDPMPLAESSPATSIGNIVVDGHNSPLWHGTMHSHSDLSAHSSGPLPILIGMPPPSSWPMGVGPFHDVTLDGYFTCWVDSQRSISVVVYAVAASYPEKHGSPHNNRSLINDELLTLMKSAKLVDVQ